MVIWTKLVMLISLVRTGAFTPIINITRSVNLDKTIWKSHNSTFSNQTHFRLALTNALQIISSQCEIDFERVLSRIAPLEFYSMGQNVLMQTRTVFVLENTTTTLGNRWTPMCLMIQKETDPSTLRHLLENNKYDIHIAVNTDVDLIIGDANCEWAAHVDTRGFYSTVSVLLHELLHGLGIYSLVDSEYNHGIVSIYDSMLRFVGSDEIVFASPAHVKELSGHELAGKEISIASHVVYNPPEFVTGISLSHFQGDEIMHPVMESQYCNFEIGNVAIDALTLMGWKCNRYVPDVETTCSDNTGCACILGDLCISCDHTDAVDTIVDVILVSVLIVCTVLLYAIWKSTHLPIVDTYKQQSRCSYVPINTI